MKSNSFCISHTIHFDVIPHTIHFDVTAEAESLFDKHKAWYCANEGNVCIASDSTTYTISLSVIRPVGYVLHFTRICRYTNYFSCNPGSRDAYTLLLRDNNVTSN